jgi:hypothetical protein
MATQRISQTFIRKCLERRAETLLEKLYNEIEVPPEVLEARTRKAEANKIYSEMLALESEWYTALRKKKSEIKDKVMKQVASMEEEIILGGDNEEAKALLQKFEAWEPQ